MLSRSREETIPVSKVIDALNNYTEHVIVTIDPTHALKYMAATDEDAIATVNLIRERKTYLELTKRMKKTASELAPWLILGIFIILAFFLIYKFFVEGGSPAPPPQVITTPPPPKTGGIKI